MRRALALAACALAACDPALDQRLALVDGPRVLAVIAEPPEGRPGAALAYRAVVGGPDGPIEDAPAWAYCLAPKPPTEDNAVAPGCLGEGPELIALGTAPEVTAPLPTDACLRFGPDTPPGGFRPRDPDATGGYYQPVRADVLDQRAFGLARVTCALPTAPADVAREYALGYAANANPTLLVDDLPAAPPDAEVTLTAAWPAEAAQPYLWFDPLAQALVTRREAMRVSWFATGGALAVDASAVAEDDPATSVSTTWRTPGPGTAWLWVVLRDSRGGIAARALRVEIR